MKITQTSRRSFLKTAGLCLALPLMESYTAPKRPHQTKKKLIFCGLGFGFTEDTFFPQEGGRLQTLPLGMQPLARHKQDITVISNLTNHGCSDPHEGSTNFLTGANLYGTSGKRFHNSISCDVLAGESLGADMRYNQLSLTGGDGSGHGKGLSMSWSRAGKTVSGIKGPQALYARLFGQEKESPQQRQRRLAKKQSILDAVAGNSRYLNAKLTRTDKEKLDEYFQSIREIEQGLIKEAAWAQQAKPKVEFKLPKQIDGIAEIKLTYELMALALQSNQTAVISYRQPTNSLLKSLGIHQDPHALSHYSGSTTRTAASEKRDHMCTELLANFLDLLKSKKLADGSSLYEQSTLCWGSNIRTGHMLKNLPMIVAGNALEKIKHGRHLILPEEDTPLSNLWLTLLQQYGIPVDHFGDSRGTVSELFG